MLSVDIRFDLQQVLYFGECAGVWKTPLLYTGAHALGKAHESDVLNLITHAGVALLGFSRKGAKTQRKDKHHGLTLRLCAFA
jgi:hypothetical protein